MALSPTAIAWRYFTRWGRGGGSPLLLYFAMVGVFVASFSLAISLMVSEGFQREVLETLRGGEQSIVIVPAMRGGRLDPEAVSEFAISEIGKEKIENVQGISRQWGILEIEEGEKGRRIEAFVLKGVKRIFSSSPETKQIEETEKTEGSKEVPVVRVSPEFARRIGITTKGFDTKLNFLRVAEIRRSSVRLDKLPVRIAISTLPLFKNSVDDSFTAVSEMENFQKLTEQKTPAVDFVSIFFRKKWRKLEFEKKVAKRLEEAAGGEVKAESLEELFPNLLSSLRLEEIVSSLIVFLLFLLSVLAIGLSIALLVDRKRRDIAMFLVEGFSRGDVRRIFTEVALYVALVPAFFGALLAYALAFSLEKWKLIKLSKAYLVEYLPAEPSILIAVSAFLATLLAAIFAGLIASGGVKTLNVSKILREEG